MELWILMLILNLLIPLSMILFGNHFIKAPPDEINRVFGYRTTMSMKNRDTWVFAHWYCGRLWRIIGFILLIVSAAIFFMLGRDAETVGIFGGVLCGVQLICMIVPVFFTEKALRATFDRHGSRKL